MRFLTSTRRLGGLLVLWLVAAGSAQAEPKLEQVRTTKRATALVISGQGRERGQGTAFCVTPGFFVTNAHVVGNAAGSLNLVLDSGEKTQRITQAKVVRVDKDLDFALLKVEGSDSVPVLELGSSEELFETMPLTAFGFPFGTALVFDKGDYPSASVSVGRITSLRKKQGLLERIQLDASLNPGNSGGAIVDDNGRVVGIVQAGIPGAGLNFAIPVSNLKKFLDRPEVTITVPPILFEKQNDEHELVVNVATFRQVESKWTVELTVGDSASQTTAAVDNFAKFRFIPVAKPKGPKQFRLVIKFSGGVVMGNVDERTLKLGSEQIELSRIRRIDKAADQARVTLTDNKVVTGTFAAQTLAVHLGQADISVDVAQADSVVVEPVEKPVKRVAYQIHVKDGANSVGLINGSIDFIISAATQGEVYRKEADQNPVAFREQNTLNQKPNRTGRSYPIRSAIPDGYESVAPVTFIPKGTKLQIEWANRWLPVTSLEDSSEGPIQIRWDGYSSAFDEAVIRECIIIDKKTQANHAKTDAALP